MSDPASERERLRTLRSVFALRDRLLRAMRRFFHERGFLEVCTPVRLAAFAPEEHLEAEPSGEFFLRASPELHLKRLLAAGYPRVFEIGPCFRREEQGPAHQPEFTMLEWYRTHATYADLLADAKALLLTLADEVLGRDELVYQGTSIDLRFWERLTVRDAFVQFAGWDPVQAFDAERFDVDLVTKVEPQLPPHTPVVLMDYPAERAGLARLSPDNPRIAERWELYVGGLELANAGSELTDPAEVRARFENWNRQRALRGRPVYPPDEDFLAVLEAGVAPAAGIALGVDRLVMLFADKPIIQDVLPFPRWG